MAPAPDVSATWQRRLCDRIGPAGEHAFVVVDAPAGCGKSALLASWAAEQRGPVVWLSLEPGDNEPIRFWSMARRAIDASGAQVRRADVDGNVPGTRAYVDAIVAALARSDGPTAIVVDDAHHVVNPRVIRTALDAIWRVNRRITIVVGTRIPAPADTAERFARLGWCHLGSDDLRLTTDEVAEIVDQLGSPADAGDLHAATDGWAIAAVHGARSAMYRTDVDEPRSDMTDYVRHEVLDALPDRLRDLVLRTAHLPWLSAELCAAVTGDADTPTSLAALADRRLLRPLPGHTGWYRCLGVVRDACIEITRHDDTIDVRRLHRSTAEWWHLRGRTDLALDHAIAGDDRVLVPQLAGDVLMAAFSRSAAYTCRRLLGELDPDVVAADRRSLDVATCLAGLLLDPPGAERWSSARRAIVSEPDPISMCVRIHRAYLDGRAGESVRLARAAKGTLGPYFDEHGGHPDLRRVIARVLDVADFAGRVLGGRLRHADTTNGHAPPTGHFDSWSIRARLVGETAFLAVVDGDVDAALAMLATFDSDPSDVDAPLPLGAVRLVATEAIITLMTTDDEAAARSAIDRLDPLAAALWDLRWHVELIPVYLALSMAHQRVGDPLAASRRIDDVDVLLAMCEDADLMIRARSLLDTSFATHDADTVAVDALTEGERRVVDLVSDGLSNRDVAARLDVSPLTVAGHMQSAFRKLGVRSRHGAVMRVRAHRRLRR